MMRGLNLVITALLCLVLLSCSKRTLQVQHQNPDNTQPLEAGADQDTQTVQTPPNFDNASANIPNPFLVPMLNNSLPPLPFALAGRQAFVGLADRSHVVTDINKDGYLDVLLGALPGEDSIVTLHLGDPGGLRTITFNAYPAYRTGVYVAAGDLDGDGVLDIVTGTGPGAPPVIRALNGALLMAGIGVEAAQFHSFTAFSLPNLQGGVRVATIDFDGNDRYEIIAASGPGDPLRVVLYEGLSDYPIVTKDYLEGVGNEGLYVASGQVGGFGVSVLVGTGAGTTPTVWILSPFLSGDWAITVPDPLNSLQGVRPMAFDYDGDGTAEILTTPGPGPNTRVHLFKGLYDGTEKGGFNLESSPTGIFSSVYEIAP